MSTRRWNRGEADESKRVPDDKSRQDAIQDSEKYNDDCGNKSRTKL